MASEKITQILEEVKSLTILELADLVMICEEKFNITINDDDIRKFTTVGDVVAYLETLDI